ncbi:MAG: peroxiredoxin [Planctomycetota bacterium]|nr:peroxiredoxin [Planctomycetota bacterium]
MKNLAVSLSLLVAACLLVGSTISCAADDAAALKAGDTAPDFKLEGSDGKTYELKDFAGKQAVVIAWYPKAFTGGCTIECKNMKENGEAIRAFDVAYFTASTDTAEDNKKFAESLELDYPILSDPEKTTAKAYGVLGVGGYAKRHTIYIGADGKIKHVETKVDVKNTAKDIADKLKELDVPAKSEKSKS